MALRFPATVCDYRLLAERRILKWRDLTHAAIATKVEGLEKALIARVDRELDNRSFYRKLNVRPAQQALKDWFLEEVRRKCWSWRHRLCGLQRRLKGGERFDDALRVRRRRANRVECGIGCSIDVSAEGPDAEEAMEALTDLVARKFDEDQ